MSTQRKVVIFLGVTITYFIFTMIFVFQGKEQESTQQFTKFQLYPNGSMHLMSGIDIYHSLSEKENMPHVVNTGLNGLILNTRYEFQDQIINQKGQDKWNIRVIGTINQLLVFKYNIETSLDIIKFSDPQTSHYYYGITKAELITSVPLFAKVIYWIASLHFFGMTVATLVLFWNDSLRGYQIQIWIALALTPALGPFFFLFQRLTISLKKGGNSKKIQVLT